MTTRRRHVITAAAALGGVALFAYALHRAGVDEILDGVRRVGWGLLPILALAGARFLLRAQCWRLCMPPASRLSLRQAFVAFLAGDAVGNVTPLGMAASEPAKVLLTRHRLATREAVASLTVDNLVYAASVATVVALGVVVMLVTVPLPFAWRETAVVALVGLADHRALVGGLDGIEDLQGLETVLLQPLQPKPRHHPGSTRRGLDLDIRRPLDG